MGNSSTRRFAVIVTLILVVVTVNQFFNVDFLEGATTEPRAPTDFFPLDINQRVALESIRRALQHSPKDKIQVDLVCAVSKNDFEALANVNASLPCHRFVILKRSTRTQYSHLKSTRDLPFVSDIIDAATAANRTDPDLSFHVMITNADIGLSKHFYEDLLSLLQKYDAVSINRVTIAMENITLTTTTNWTNLLENQIDTLLSHGSKHPGFDLFCISSSVLKRVSFGDFFLGRPPWGANIHLMLKIMADNYVNVKSSPYGTFHLGNDRSRWKSDKPTVGSPDSNSSQQLWKFCPWQSQAGSDVLTMQNHINCGHWYLGNYSIPSLPWNKSSSFIPGFVRTGFEALYRERYWKHLVDDDQGLPLPTEFQTPSKKTKADGALTKLIAAQKKRHQRAKTSRGDKSVGIQPL